MSGRTFDAEVRAFYELHRDALYAYARSLTTSPSDAEDAVHGAFHGLLVRGRMPLFPRPYMFRAVRNLAIDGHRRRRTAEAVRVGLEPVPAADPLRRSMAAEALDAASPDERDVILLKIVGGLTFREIALLRRRSINTVASWYARGLEKARARWEKP